MRFILKNNSVCEYENRSIGLYPHTLKNHFIITYARTKVYGCGTLLLCFVKWIHRRLSGARNLLLLILMFLSMYINQLYYILFQHINIKLKLLKHIITYLYYFCRNSDNLLFFYIDNVLIF